MSRKIIGSVVLNPTSSAPTSPTEGEMYYNSDDSNLYIYDGSQWNRVGEADQVIKYTQDFTSQTSVVVAHGLGTIPMIQVYNGSGEVLVADTITHDSINQTTVTFGVAQTGTILCIGSESSNSPIAYTTQYTTTFTAQTSVTVTHNLGAKPIVQVRDSGDEILIPTSINHTTDNSLVVTFDSSESGYVECIVGGVSNISPSGNADMVDGFNASATPEANKLLALDGSAKLPAVDGSQLTNLPSNGITILGSGYFVSDGTTDLQQVANFTTPGDIGNGVIKMDMTIRYISGAVNSTIYLDNVTGALGAGQVDVTPTDDNYYSLKIDMMKAANPETSATISSIEQWSSGMDEMEGDYSFNLTTVETVFIKAQGISLNTYGVRWIAYLIN